MSKKIRVAFLIGFLLLAYFFTNAQQHPFVFLGYHIVPDEANTVHAGPGHYAASDNLYIWTPCAGERFINVQTLDTVSAMEVERLSFHKFNVDSLDHFLIEKFETMFKDFLLHADSNSFPVQYELQQWIYYYWNQLLEDSYKIREKDNDLETLSELNLEPLIKYDDVRKCFITGKKIFQRRYSIRYGNYAEAAKQSKELYCNSSNKAKAQDLLRLSYLPVLCNSSEQWSYAGRDLETAIIRWYNENKTAFASSITSEPTDMQFMLADYYILFGENDTLRQIIHDLRKLFYENKDNLKFKKADPEWYGFLCNYFLDQSVPQSKNYNSIKKIIEEAGFKATTEHLSEFVCQYVLDLLSNHDGTFDIDNIKTLLWRVNKDIEFATSDVINYAEKYIIEDLLTKRLPKIATSSMYIHPNLFLRTEQKNNNELSVIFNLTPGTDTISKIEVWFNNKILVKQTNLKESLEIDKTCTLNEGNNSLTIQYEYSNHAVDSTLTFNYTPRRYTQRKDLALLFAVNEYTDSTITSFDGSPLKEVDTLALLFSQFGFDTMVIRNPTRNEIIKYLETYSGYKKDPENPCDQLVVFFSCHGVYNKTNKRGYIVPKDAVRGNFEQTMISYSYIYDQLNTSPYKHILLISDACHSGAFLAVTKGDENTNQIDKTLDELMRHTGRFFIGAASIEEKAPESSELVQTLLNLFNEKLAKKEMVTIYNIFEKISTNQQKQKPAGQWGETDPGYSSTFIFEPK